MEGILGVDCQTADFCATRFEGPRYRAGFRAIAVEGEGFQGCSSQIDRVPFQHQGRLGCISKTEDGWGGRLDAVGVQDTLLKCLECCCTRLLGRKVARNSDVDYAAGRDIVWKED